MPTFENPAADAVEVQTALRALAHATRSIDDPRDIYSVIGSLTVALGSLSQSLHQLAGFHDGANNKAKWATEDNPKARSAAYRVSWDLHRAGEMVRQVGEVVEDQPLDAWSFEVDAVQCPAIVDCLGRGKAVMLDHLCRDPRNRENPLPAVVLLLKRGSTRTLLPDPHTEILAGDEILVCGKHRAEGSMKWITGNYNVLRYIRTGVEAPGGLVWQWLSAKREKPPAARQ